MAAHKLPVTLVPGDQMTHVCCANIHADKITKHKSNHLKRINSNLAFMKMHNVRSSNNTSFKNEN